MTSDGRLCQKTLVVQQHIWILEWNHGVANAMFNDVELGHSVDTGEYRGFTIPVRFLWNHGAVNATTDDVELGHSVNTEGFPILVRLLTDLEEPR